MEEEAKILIVDDDPDVREALKTILETQPYQLCFRRGGMSEEDRRSFPRLNYPGPTNAQKGRI